MRDESSIIADIEYARELNEQLIKGQTSLISDLDMDITAAINNTSAMLKAIISIKTELCRLPFSFCEREYVDNCVTPLLIVLVLLTVTSVELAISISILTFSPIVPSKKSKLKDTIHLIYNINDECEELYKVLKKRLKSLIQDNANCYKFT